MVRTASYSIHGLVPASCVAANRYDREAVVKCLGDDVGLNPPLKLGQLPSTPDELLKLDQVRDSGLRHPNIIVSDNYGVVGSDAMSSCHLSDIQYIIIPMLALLNLKFDNYLTSRFALCNIHDNEIFSDLVLLLCCHSEVSI